jgi:hypothetical protein
MSKEYEGRDFKDIAAQAERDLNDKRHNFGYQDGTGFGGKTVGGGSTSSKFFQPTLIGRKQNANRVQADESGIDQAVTKEFPGSTAGKSPPASADTVLPC